MNLMKLDDPLKNLLSQNLLFYFSCDVFSGKKHDLHSLSVRAIDKYRRVELLS